MTRFEIRIRDGERYCCSDGDTILRSALRAGLGFPYECNTGSCGTCKFELLSGRVDTLWEEAPGRTERDRKRNRHLGCQSRPSSDCEIGLRLDSACVPASPPQRFEARLEHASALTHDLRELRFRAEEPARFRPGQYALFDHPDVAGFRAYSMCNLPNDGGEWHFHIKRVPGGALTTRLFNEFRPGDPLPFDGPYGLAFLREDAPRDLILVAGGSGLSPMVSIARAATAAPALTGRRIHFFYGGRAPADMCAEAVLRDLPGFGDRIRLHASISNPALDPGGRWPGARGFVHALVEEQLGDELGSHEIYFAGPPPMIRAMTEMLRNRKVRFEQVHWDNFY